MVSHVQPVGVSGRQPLSTCPYDFTTRVDRTGTGACKWNAMCEANPDVAAGIVPFSVADMEFVTAPELVEALTEFAQTAVLGYTDPTDAYFDAVLNWQAERHGWQAERDWVVLSPGVVPAVAMAVRAFTNPGDGVVIMTPVYHPFRRVIEAAGRTVVENPLLLDEDALRYAPDFDGLERVCADPRTTMLVLCSPHNPVGRVWDRGELARIARICCDHGVFLCSDEIHNDLVMPGYRHTVVADVMPAGRVGDCAVLTAPSKTFNLAGVQCSNIFIPDPDRRAAFKKAASDFASFHSLNAFAYPLCRAAYERCGGWLDACIQVIAGNHRAVADFCAERLPQLRVFPLEGTYLQWVDCRGLGLDAAALERFMTREALMFCDEGTMFGEAGAGFERINLACPRDVLLEALERLERAVRDLTKTPSA